MTTAIIINMALAIPVFVAIIGLALWSFRTQTADRAHVLARRTRRAIVRSPQLSGAGRTASPAH
jgi:hypothetical protein